MEPGDRSSPSGTDSAPTAAYACCLSHRLEFDTGVVVGIVGGSSEWLAGLRSHDIADFHPRFIAPPARERPEPTLAATFEAVDRADAMPDDANFFASLNALAECPLMLLQAPRAAPEIPAPNPRRAPLHAAGRVGVSLLGGLFARL